VGSARSGPGSERAFLWTPSGGIVDLGTLGGTQSSATAVNANGQVVGSAFTADDVGHAVLWSFELPVVMLTVPSPLVTYAATRAPVAFTVTSTLGTPACTADGSPFTSGELLAVGTHTIVCTATERFTGAAM